MLSKNELITFWNFRTDKPIHRPCDASDDILNPSVHASPDSSPQPRRWFRGSLNHTDRLQYPIVTVPLISIAGDVVHPGKTIANPVRFAITCFRRFRNGTGQLDRLMHFFVKK
jgi:hypothetical protein